MITRADINERVREWGLTEEVVEKDYVLGWLLWGIGSDPVLAQTWVFKGGTCLKKCYIETYRFSEDLDFTVLPGGPFRPDDVEPLLLRTLSRIAAESGIDFSKPPRLRLRPNGISAEGRVYYTGPRRTPQPARVKLDISADEVVVRPPVLEQIAHPYPDFGVNRWKQLRWPRGRRRLLLTAPARSRDTTSVCSSGQASSLRTLGLRRCSAAALRATTAR